SEPQALTASQREAWKDAMQQVRTTIGKQQYAEAATQLDAAQSLAKTSRQSEQLRRLRTVEQLAQQFGEALQTSIAGLGAAETLIVGKSTPASFVEAADGHLSLRINGRTQTWTIEELPTGIA